MKSIDVRALFNETWEFWHTNIGWMAGVFRPKEDRREAYVHLVAPIDVPSWEAYHEQSEAMARVIAHLPEMIDALERVGESRMWRMRNGHLVWAGESPDGNEIECDNPLELTQSVLIAAGLREPVRSQGSDTDD